MGREKNSSLPFEDSWRYSLMSMSLLLLILFDGWCVHVS